VQPTRRARSVRPNQQGTTQMIQRTRRQLLNGAAAFACAFAAVPAAMAFEVSEAAKAEGQVVIATAGGFLQETLGKHLYSKFTEATGIEVIPVTINPQEQWAKVKADMETGNVQWDLVNVGPDSLVLHRDFLMDLGPDCGAVPNLRANGAPGVCQQYGFLYILGGYILGVNTEEFPDGGPKNAADFFDTERFPGPRSLSGGEPVYNMMIALAADGVPQDELWPLDIDRALAKLDTIKDDLTTWWDSSDQAMQNWRNREVVMSTFWAGRIPQLREMGEPVVPVWQGFPRDISGFGILEEAPHPEAAKAFIDFFFSEESAQAVFDFAEEINYDPPSALALEIPSETDPADRATNPDNWNAMLAMDVEILRDTREEIERRWQEWITE
jgi:mannopine transport system substrate-binding protein